MKKIFLFIHLLLLSISLFSCKKGYTLLSANSMFSISLKDPHSAVGRITRAGQNKNYFFSSNTMKFTVDFSDGYIYMVDSFMNRILKYDNNGKLQLIIYNDKLQNTTFYELAEQAPTTPLPSSVIQSKYEFNSPGVIAADSEGSIYVETFTAGTDTKPAFHYILKFDNEGKFQFKIGQDGRDGLNFTDSEFITTLFTDAAKNLYVLSRYKVEETSRHQPYGIMARVFNKDGKFLFKIRSHVLLPRIEVDRGEFAVLENLLPAPTIDAFVFSIAVYKEARAESGERVELLRKELYYINHQSNVIKKIRRFPEKELSLLASTNTGNVFLNTARGNNLDLVLMSVSGKIHKRNRIKFFTGEGKFVTAMPTSSGKILGLFFDGSQLNIFSWF